MKALRVVYGIRLPSVYAILIRMFRLVAAMCLATVGVSAMEHKYAEVNGVKLHYVEQGKGSLMLFLHGFPEFWYAWRTQLTEFGKDHKAVAVDLRGYNLSAKPERVEDYRMPLLVADIRALVEHLGYKRVTLVGHDWGGVVAWSTAMAHPDVVEKLVIINAPHPAVFGREMQHNPAQQKASQYMLMFRSADAEKTLSANGNAMLNQMVLGSGLKAGHITEADQKAYNEAWSQPGALTGGLNFYRAARVGPPREGDAPPPAPDKASMTVKVPTLVIWGEKDTALLTGNLDGLEDYVPKLAVKRIPDATHWVVHEKPQLVNRYIREFLKN
jgi:pimeloyl-ACP methyl ester carboxylesterase